MKNIIDLNAEIEKISKPEVYFHKDYQTFSFFDNWVIEIDDEYFKKWEEKIKNKINHIADLESPIKVKFLKIFHQDVLEKYKDMIKHNTGDLEYLKSIIYGNGKIHKPLNKPEKTCKDISNDKNSLFYINPVEYYNTVNKLATIFYDDGDYLILCDDDHTLEDEKCAIEDEIFKYFEDEIKKNDEIESHSNQFYPFTKTNTKDEQLEKAYSLVHLSSCLDKTRALLKKIIRYLDNLVNIIKKLENIEEDKYTIEDVFDSDPNNLKMEFKINKMDVALFYRALHDTGIIFVDNKNQKHQYTNLKKYIDNANMYYLENKKVDKVKNINKEFAKFLNSRKYKKHEINLLELLISKLEFRKEQILADKEVGDD